MHRKIINTIVRSISKVAFEKPPHSIYYLYSRENYLKLKSETEFNNLPFDKKALMDVIKGQFKNLSVEEKKELEEKLRTINEDYIKMKNMEAETKGSEIMKFAEEHGMPQKHAQSALNLYVHEIFANKKIYPELKTKDKLKQIVTDFKNLTDLELQTYNDKFSTLKTDYETLMKEWTKAKNVPFFTNRKKIAFYFYYKEKYNK